MLRKHKKLTVFLSIIATILTFFLIINIVPPKKVVKTNPFIATKEQGVMIAAHRGGKNLNPENTFKAFDYSINTFDIEILELDLCMTSDGHLVSSHDRTIDDCADVSQENYYIKDHTLQDLQKFNFGYNFKDKQGNYPYRDLLNGVAEENKSAVLLENSLRIATIEEIFAKYQNTDLKFILEIKDSGEFGKKATDELIKQMENYSLTDRVVVGTFHNEIESYLNSNYDYIYRGAAMGTAAKFVVTQMLGVNLFDSSSFSALQIPMSYELKKGGKEILSLNLTRKTYIKRAHRRNISVQYWTINDKDEMNKLIDLGADVIMTDNPDLLYEVLVERGLRKPLK